MGSAASIGKNAIENESSSNLSRRGNAAILAIPRARCKIEDEVLISVKAASTKLTSKNYWIWKCQMAYGWSLPSDKTVSPIYLCQRKS